MAYADQQMSGNRITAFIIVALIHVVVGYALVTGLAYSAAKKVIQKVTTIDIEEEVKKEEPPPPPPKKLEVPPPQKIIVPPVKIDIPIPRQTVDAQPTPTPTPTPTPIITQTAPAVSKARRATPKGQAGWARRIQDNYPASAQRAGKEGRVGVRVTIGPDGRVTSCSVSGSSGSGDLDAAACAGMERYARFDPALSDDGSPTSGSYSTTIVYRLN